MTTPQQRMTLDNPVDLLVRPSANEEPEPDDDPDDDAE